jgi:hypothetical protein
MRAELVAPMVALLVSDQTQLNGQVIVAGKGAFRRAATVEGPGLGYSQLEQLTPETLARDVERMSSMEGAVEFPDAMASFQDLFGRYPGVT